MWALIKALIACELRWMPQAVKYLEPTTMAESISLTPELVRYLTEANRTEHPALRRCREETEAKMPDLAWFQVSPEQAALMQVITKISNSNRILEVGTFTGYSALAFGLAAHGTSVSPAHVMAIDRSAEWLETAQSYWDEAGLTEVICPIVGEAEDILADMPRDGPGFDLAFIDADKVNYGSYYEHALGLLRQGGVIIIDNALWGGKVVDPTAMDDDTQAIRRLSGTVRADERVDMAFSSVGDGLIICRKR